MTRKQALTAIRTAGFHDDSTEYTRLLITNRISVHVAREAFKEGAHLRAQGARCDCNACKQIPTTPTL